VGKCQLLTSQASLSAVLQWCCCQSKTYGVLSVAAGQNKQHQAAKNVTKLDRETEELHHETVSLDLSRLIQQGRQAKGMTQKELATVSATQLTYLLIQHLLTLSH